jgi:scyllo-inositol 2-dehydrogenase (NADP+)
MSDTRGDPIAVGLLGLGNSGWFYHAERHLTGSDRYTLRAVCALDAGRANRAAAQFGAEPYTDWRSVVARPDIELVVVALPHHLHREVCVAAAAAGKHVLVEKPMAVTTAEADEMIEAAHAARVRLSVFQQRRWEADFQALRAEVARGSIGDVWRVEVTRSHAGKYRAAGTDQPHAGVAILDWPHRAASGGGISYVVGPHPVDHLLQLVDSPPEQVAGSVHRSAGEDVDDYIGLDVRFASGVLGRVDVFRRPGIAPPRFAVYGSLGTIISRDGTSLEVQPHEAPAYSIGPFERPGRHGDEVYQGLFAAIRYGAPLPVTPEQGRQVVEVLELGLRSAALGGTPQATTRALTHSQR